MRAWKRGRKGRQERREDRQRWPEHAALLVPTKQGTRVRNVLAVPVTLKQALEGQAAAGGRESAGASHLGAGSILDQGYLQGREMVRCCPEATSLSSLGWLGFPTARKARTFERSTPVRACTEAGSSASSRFTSDVTLLLSPLRTTISSTLVRGAEILAAI